MLTCQLGETQLNLLDIKYDRYQLKKWSERDLLKCPVCGGKYEYCHGEIAAPYFRHKDKECLGHYSESETEEHRIGKTSLYNWIKTQSGVSNVKLEYWIPETKQRPDIYFEYDGNRYVIEYQCTPIASELILRKELYKLNNIIDIWIMGATKYDCKVEEDGTTRKRKGRKTIEDHSNFHLDENGNLFFSYDYLLKTSSLIPKEKDRKNSYITSDINSLFIQKNKLIFSQPYIAKYKVDYDIRMKEKRRQQRIRKLENELNYWRGLRKGRVLNYLYFILSKNTKFIITKDTDFCYNERIIIKIKGEDSYNGIGKIEVVDRYRDIDILYKKKDTEIEKINIDEFVFNSFDTRAVAYYMLKYVYKKFNIGG